MSSKYKIVLTIVPLVFILDQLSKWTVQSYLKLGGFISVIPGYFDIVHVANKGAAFGMFAGASSQFRSPFFYSVSVIAVIVIVIVLIKLPENDKFMALIFSLILGGIAGNILDRVRFGQVTDFLSVHIRDKVADTSILGHQLNFRLEWPAFNVADSAITIAMVLLVWSLVKPARKRG